MEYRNLGRSDCKVSAIGLGVMTFGAQTAAAAGFAQLDLAYDAGINLFDTAENYPGPVSPESQGRSEEILGDWAVRRKLRDKIVIATKVTGPGGMEHIRGAGRRLDRRNIGQAVDASLRRLQTDYIDLYQLHWPDRLMSTTGRVRYSLLTDPPELVAIEETLAAMNGLVTAGKIRQIGVCNESAWGIMRYLDIAARTNAARVVSVQNHYNLLNRLFEMSVAEVAVREDVGLLAYSPLASGLLTGKYGPAGANAAADSRFAVMPETAKRLQRPRALAAAQAYVELAKSHGLDPTAMALAFVRDRPFTTSVLMAARTVEQLQNNLGCAELRLPPALVKQIDAIHDANPNPAP